MQSYKIKPCDLKRGERLLLEKNVMRARLENLEDKIRTLEETCEKSTGKSADGGGLEGRGGECEETEELKKEYRALACELRSLERGLSLLDSQSRAVLDAFYVNRAPGAADRLCELLNLERSHVYRLKVRALEKFCGAMPFSSPKPRRLIDGKTKIDG